MIYATRHHTHTSIDHPVCPQNQPIHQGTHPLIPTRIPTENIINTPSHHMENHSNIMGTQEMDTDSAHTDTVAVGGGKTKPF